MNKYFYTQLAQWPKHFVCTSDLHLLLPKGAFSRYGVVKRALKAGVLISLRRGVYLIADKMEKEPVNAFELAQILYGPSYISFEAALSFHGWIPEAVRTTTSASIKRSIEVDTPIGHFTFTKVPSDNFFLGVSRIVQNHAVFFIADPWRAVADYIYAKNRSWKNINSFAEDMRIEAGSFESSNKRLATVLSQVYPNARTRRHLSLLLGGS